MVARAYHKHLTSKLASNQIYTNLIPVGHKNVITTSLPHFCGITVIYICIYISINTTNPSINC